MVARSHRWAPGRVGIWVSTPGPATTPTPACPAGDLMLLLLLWLPRRLLLLLLAAAATVPLPPLAPPRLL
jgi:hypothetical protein